VQATVTPYVIKCSHNEVVGGVSEYKWKFPRTRP